MPDKHDSALPAADLTDNNTLYSTTIQSPYPDDAGQQWHTITSDHKIWKRIVTPTTIPNAQLCQPLYRVTIRIQGKFDDGSTFIDSGNDERDLILGHATQARGVEIALATMYVGERARLYMTSEYGWASSSKKRPELLQRDDVRDMYYDITVVRQEQELSVNKMTLSDKIQYIEQRRTLGKQLYTEQKYESALRQYERGLQVLTQSFDKNNTINVGATNIEQPNNTQESDLKQNECLFYINQSQCYYKLQRYNECLTSLNNALKLQPNNVKALYRRSLVYKQRDDTELMLQDLRRIRELEHSDQQLLHTVNSMIKQAEKQQADNDRYLAKQYAGMFDRVDNNKKNGLGLYEDTTPPTLLQRVTDVWNNVVNRFRSMCKRSSKVKTV